MRHAMAPPVEDPDYVTQTNLNLVPTLCLSRDELGFSMVHKKMFVVHPI